MGMSQNTFPLIAALCLACGAGTAQAHGAELQWSVTIGTPLPAPRVVVPAGPAPVYLQPVWVGVPAARVYLPRGYRQVSRWDHDGDGIPNRRDRYHHPRWDRDGDGVPNHRDRHPAQGRRGDGSRAPAAAWR